MFFLLKKLTGLWLGRIGYWLWKLVKLWFRSFLIELVPLALVAIGLLILLVVYKLC